jgi:aspartyl-tRNA(Asn)/glutamyl-tRNA(Gln) amidotransferase subunit B
MNYKDKYDIVIGLEVHMQLLTKTKAFSSDINEYGSMPNTNVSVVSLGHPGTLPRLNTKSVEFAIKLGLVTHCDIREYNRFARKNYFYADLPKGYQITQHDTPICSNGFIDIKLSDNSTKRIGIERIHIEEDAGKSIHDQDPFHTLIDLNRAGVPLLEMVTKPDMRSSEEANLYLTKIRQLVRYLDICDGNMEEGSLRCDANISIMPKGVSKFGTKVEVKNMNSIRNVQRAIEYEYKRQAEVLEKGEKLYQETRSFDAATGTTTSMRSKESDNDYRYFPEPDLTPIIVTEQWKSEIKKTIPPLPDQLFDKYLNNLGLSEYDAQILTDDKATAYYFEDLIKETKNYKSAANWIMGSIKSYLNENAKTIEEFTLDPKKIAEIISLIDSGKINNTIATQKLFPALLENPDESATQLCLQNNWIQEQNTDLLAKYVKEVLDKNPEKVAEYRAGKKGLLGMFMGEVMKLSKGKADPKETSKMLEIELNQ